MTTRERTLALVMFPLFAVVGGGFFIYQLWWEPLRIRDARIADLHTEIHDRQESVNQILKSKRDNEKYRTISLPADADLARREYEEQLNKLLRQCGFDAGSFSIVPKPIDTRTSPTQLNKKPIYSRLIFTINAKGDLASFVEFLEKFYQLPLLHQIRNIDAHRQLSGPNRNTELEVNLTIEAIVLDNAEPRKALLPEKKPDLPALLAGGLRKYSHLAGKNIFFGPPPAVATTTAPTVRKSDTDYAQFVKFVSVTDGENGQEASFYDEYNSQEYSIKPKGGSDGFVIDVSYILGGRRRSLRNGNAIELLDENGEIQHRWVVLRVTDRELYVQDQDYYYVLHIGQRLSEITKLKTEEAKSLGLTSIKKPAEEKK